MTHNGFTLAQKYPEIALQADGWDPSTVSSNSGRVLPWKCGLGHRWNAMVNNRTKGRGCPVCAGKSVLAGFNDLATTHPDIAKEADGWDPQTIRPGSNMVVNWKCPKNHQWTGSINNRTSGRGCPVCAGKSVLAGFNDLATTHPDIAKEADGWDPQTVTHGTQKKYRWKCSKGHQFVASVSSRTGFNQTGCPVCAGKSVLAGFNDLATTHPDIAKEADGWDPRTVTPFSGVKRQWLCRRGHSWSAVIASRSSGRGCPVCAGKTIRPGFNDLATTHPDIAKEADGWDPQTVRPGTHRKVRWVCPIGHSYQSSPHSRTGNNKSGCAICSGQQLLIGFNDLATTHPDIAKEADGWDPVQVIAGSNKRFKWRCAIGHTWDASVNGRTGKNQSGCPVCVNKKVLKGFNDLATTNPVVAEQAHDWDPTTVTRSSSKKKQWICQFGHTWYATPADRSRGNGCPTCSKGGFDPNRDAWLYFITHDEWKMNQIGITNNPDLRLKSHERLGWRLIEIRGPLSGHHIQDLETAALKALRQRGALLANKAGGAPFDGWTEAWMTSSVDVDSISQILDWVYEDESK